MKDARVIACGTKSETLYKTACINMVVVGESISNSSLRHNRLGHMVVSSLGVQVARITIDTKRTQVFA